jgi:DNA (cytosine-5)-methyltransferase 1
MTPQATPSGSVTTVELFAGIGGFRIAADKLGLRTVFSNDIDSVASDVYRARFPDARKVHRQGDIFKFLDDVPKHQILTGGFPCQPFSFAGKKKGISDQRATTLDAICEVLHAKRPSVFVLENVRSLLTIAHGKHFAAVLQRLTSCGYFVEWKVFNTAELGLPQNRNRVLLLGTRKEQATRLLGDNREWDAVHGNANQMRDILKHKNSFPEWGIAAEDQFAGFRPEKVPKAPLLLLKDVLDPVVDPSFDFTEATIERIKESTPVHQIIDGVEVLYNQEGGRRMGYTIYGVNGVAPTLTCTSSRHYERFLVDGRYRRLTPTEYARIQGFPDDHCSVAPPGKQYVLCGNAIPPLLAEIGLRAALKTLR